MGGRTVTVRVWAHLVKGPSREGETASRSHLVFSYFPRVASLPVSYETTETSSNEADVRNKRRKLEEIGIFWTFFVINFRHSPVKR